MYHVFAREFNGQEQSREFPSLQDALDWCLMGFLHSRVLSIEIREDADYANPGIVPLSSNADDFCCLLCDGSGKVLRGGKTIPCSSCHPNEYEAYKAMTQ